MLLTTCFQLAHIAQGGHIESTDTFVCLCNLFLHHKSFPKDRRSQLLDSVLLLARTLPKLPVPTVPSNTYLLVIACLPAVPVSTSNSPTFDMLFVTTKLAGLLTFRA